MGYDRYVCILEYFVTLAPIELFVLKGLAKYKAFVLRQGMMT